jgi:hypothetical protein
MRFYITSFLCIFCSCMSDKHRHNPNVGVGFFGVCFVAFGLWILSQKTVKNGEGAPIWLQGTFFRNLALGLIVIGAIMAWA